MNLWPRIRAQLERETLSARDLADRLDVPPRAVHGELRTHERSGDLLRIELRDGPLYWRLSLGGGS